MSRVMEFEMEEELEDELEMEGEYELEGEYEREYELESELNRRTAVRPRVLIRYARRSSRESEFENFDPRPPEQGTALLTRFSFGGSTLSATHRSTINQIAAATIAIIPRVPPLHCIFLPVEGHEDEVGNPALYRRIGVQRATNVAEALAARIRALLGRVPAASRRSVIIEVLSAGPSRPIRSNVTADGRALNRRVEIRRRIAPCGPIA